MRRIAAVLLLVLSSCAVIAPGRNEFVPLESRAGFGIIHIDEPGVWFVKVPAIVTIPVDTRKKAFEGKITFDELKVGLVSKQNVNWVKLENATIPEGWAFELVRQEASREVTKVTVLFESIKQYEVLDSLNLIFKVSIPNQSSDLALIRAQLGVLGSSEKGAALLAIQFKDESNPTP
jgi:hypothetical protein